MHNAFGHNYKNSSVTVDLAMGQISCSTERISSLSIRHIHILVQRYFNICELQSRDIVAEKGLTEMVHKQTVPFVANTQ